MKTVDWSRQHCGVISATVEDLIKYMPDLEELIMSFPENPSDYLWDVKVHMLMPEQFPCITNWHFDNIPRVDGKQDFSLIQPSEKMWLWLSGEPLTLFKNNEGSPLKVPAQTWVNFSQEDEHRGVASEEFLLERFHQSYS